MARVYSSGDTAMAEPSRPLRINERIAFTTYLSLSNCTYQRDFDTYKAAEQSLSSKIASITLLFVVIVVQLFWRFQQSSSIQTYAVGFGVLLPLLMLMYLYASTRKQQYGDSSSRVSVRIIGDMLIISRLLVQGLLIISVAKEGQCDDRVRVPWNCNPVHDQGELPMAYVTNLIFGMITLPVMFRCHTALVNLISIVCYGVVLVTALYFSNSRVFSYVSLLLIVFGILLTMYDYEYMIAQAFATKMEHSALLLATAENEKSMLMHENAQDARHFIGNVAHDLKTPLQALTSEIELLEREQSCSAGSFEPLRSTCCYMTMTINRSLDYFKSSSGFDLIPNMESVSLLGCLQWVKSCIEQHTKQGIQIIIEPMDDKISHKVRTDKQWLLENMLCLVSNSVKYTCYDGKVSMRVSLKTSVDNKSYLQFEVEDNGVGITVDKMVTLFQPSVRPRHSTGGTGLGLYALRSRTKALGGECGGGNRRDGGSGMLIWFTIPYHPDHSVEATAELVYEDIEANEAISSDVVHILPGEKSINRRILVVDDSIIIQKTTSRLLHNMGYEADVANNGTECLQRLKQQKYILVLMDIEMPVMNGIEAIQRIRADEATCALGSQITKNLKKQFVIGFSANSDAEMRDIALKAGMNDFMEKPLDISTLKKRCLLHKIVLSIDFFIRESN